MSQQQGQDGEPGLLTPSTVLPECHSPPTLPCLPSFPSPFPSSVSQRSFTPTHSQIPATTAWEAGHLGLPLHACLYFWLSEQAHGPSGTTVFLSEPRDPLWGEQAEIHWGQSSGIKTLLPTQPPSILAQARLWGLALLLPPFPQRTHIFHAAGAQERMNVCPRDDDCSGKAPWGGGGDSPSAQRPHGLHTCALAGLLTASQG